MNVIGLLYLPALRCTERNITEGPPTLGLAMALQQGSQPAHSSTHY